jgi:predicted lipase
VLKSYGRGVGKALLLLPKYEAPYDKPACSQGGWTATTHVKSDTEVLKFVNDEQRLIVFGFRGTESSSLSDWFKNIDFQPTTSKVGGTAFKTHKGFKDRYNNIASWFESEYSKAIETKYTIILTGHSLGGAEAAIAAVHAAGKLNRRPDAVVTFGAPLVGNSDFVKYYQNNVGCDRTLRFISKGDIVPGMPNVFGYAHVCDETEVNGGGDFLQAHDLHVGYRKGLANKYGNSNDIKAGCDQPLPM